VFAGLESATVLAICDARQPNPVAVIVIGVVPTASCQTHEEPGSLPRAPAWTDSARARAART
jgi:hypothetical protein